jgi:hypothetical protein
MTTIAFSGSIGPVPIDVVIREKHEATLTITQVPVEVGADMTDHAYVEPCKLSLEIADGAAAETWAALERFQGRREPFTIVTGLKVYTNMLMSLVAAERDETHSGIFNGNIDLQEVLIAETAVVADTGGTTRTSATAGTVADNPNAARTPSPTTTTGTQTQARAASTTSRGDAVTVPVEPASPARQSVLSRLLN